MLQRLAIKDNEEPETARRRLDGQLDVKAWITPGNERKILSPRDPKAPWWWSGAEEASQSFLTSMGVNLA